MSEIMNEVARPSLKQLAVVLDVQMDRIRSVAKKPIVGQAYDPKAINWDAIETFISNRLERTGYDSIEDVFAAALEVEDAKPARAAKAEIAMLDVEGSETTPARKIEVNAGDTIYEKKTGTEYKVEFVNETIVVFSPISLEGKLTLSRSIGNRNFNSKFTTNKPVIAEAQEEAAE